MCGGRVHFLVFAVATGAAAAALPPMQPNRVNVAELVWMLTGLPFQAGR